MNRLVFQALYVSKLTLNGVSTLCTSTVNMALPVKAELGTIPAAALTQLETDTEDLEAQSNKNQKSIITDVMKPLDKVRDSSLNEIKRVSSSYMKSSDEDKKAAAITLEQFLAPYWDAVSLPLNIETGVVAELVVKYKARPELVAAAHTLGIDKVFTSLETKNTEFDALYLSRNTEYSERETSGSSLKPATIGSYMQFCTAIEQAANLTPNPAILALFYKMDELRKKYHALGGGGKDTPATDAPAK